MSWLMNNFRVGKKVWQINDTEVGRTIAGAAYVYLMGYKPDEENIRRHYHEQRKAKGGFAAMMEGASKPGFAEFAFKEIWKQVESGIICKRKLNHRYGGIQLHLDPKNDYRYESVYTNYNQEGPRTYLSERQIKAYILDACLKAVSYINYICEHDDSCDQMGDALDEMTRDWEEDYNDHLAMNYHIDQRDYSVDFVFDKETLLNNSHMSKLLAKSGKQIKGVLTKEEMQEKVDKGQTITCIRNNEVFFFTDDYCIGVGYLPNDLVSSSSVMPHEVAPREAFPDGILKTVDDYIKLHHIEKMYIGTVDELIDYLNKTYSRPYKAEVATL
jgi:hypothetical protein